MCEMDTPDIDTIASMAEIMSVGAIISHFKEKGVSLQIVTDGIYPIGLSVGDRTMFVPALQAEDNIVRVNFRK